MEVDYQKVQNTLFAWILLHTIDLLPKDKEEDLLGKIQKQSKINVMFAINGTPVPIEKAFGDYQDLIDDMVAEQAGELIEEALGDFTATMLSIADGVERAVGARCKKELGIDIKPAEY